MTLCKTAWDVGKRKDGTYAYIWVYAPPKGLLISDKTKWHDTLTLNHNVDGNFYRGLIVLNPAEKTGYVLSYAKGNSYNTHTNAEFIPEDVWRAIRQEFKGYTLSEKTGMEEAIKKDQNSGHPDNRYKTYFLRGLRNELQPPRQFASKLLKKAWNVGRNKNTHTFIWMYTPKGLIVSDKTRWHADLARRPEHINYRGLIVLNVKNKTGYVVSYKKGDLWSWSHDDLKSLPNDVWKAIERKFKGYKLEETTGMGDAVKEDKGTGDDKYKNYFLRDLKLLSQQSNRLLKKDLQSQSQSGMSARHYVSKFLNKKAWEGEQFTYFGMQFDVEKAEKIIAVHPRPPEKAPKKFLESFVGSTKQDEEEEKTNTFSLLNVGLNKEHVQGVDENKPGIVAVITFKPSKSYPEPSTNTILIDGNHRAKKRLRMGLEDMDVYILTPEETWQVMAPNTFPGLLKNLVNPTKKESKPRAPRPKSDKPSKVDARKADLQARLDFITQHPHQFEAYIDKFGDFLWLDNPAKEKEYLESELKKKKAHSGYYTPKEVVQNVGISFPLPNDAEWYELLFMPREKEPLKKGIIRINDSWAYVPVQQQQMTAAAKYYHGSSNPLKLGMVLTPGNWGGLQSHPALKEHEVAMEQLRPKNCISRQNCVYMCGSPEDVKRAGGGQQYIYEVTPKGQVDKSDQAWFGASDNLSSAESFDAIANYWDGKPYSDKRESLWEYRAKSVIVGNLIQHCDSFGRPVKQQVRKAGYGDWGEENEEYDYKGCIDDYVYVTNCVNSDGDSITDMVDRGREVSYNLLKRHCQGLRVWEQSHGYVRDGLPRSKGLTLRNDYAVRFYKSKYRGKECYYIDWSAIEWVWVKK